MWHEFKSKMRKKGKIERRRKRTVVFSEYKTYLSGTEFLKPKTMCNSYIPVKVE